MNGGYNLYNTEASFRKYLLAENKSAITIKNYGSDLRHFIGWVTLSKRLYIREASEMDQIISIETLGSYIQELEDSNIPIKTINRRLSTLRRFCTFCISQGWMSHNPAKNIQNRILHASPNRNISISHSLEHMINEMKLDLTQTEGSYQSTQIAHDVEEFNSIISSNILYENAK